MTLPRLRYIGPWLTEGQARRVVELAEEHDAVQIVSLGKAYIRIAWHDGDIDLNAAGEEVEDDELC